jgi:hypothetical protein
MLAWPAARLGFYVVRAVNGIGPGGFSNEVSASIP